MKRITDFLTIAPCLGSPAIALLALFLAMGPARAETRPPNIILILADDLGYGDVGCYGATAIPTPNIDALAREGLRFTDGHATAATCTPSRFSLLTGKYAWREKGTNILPGDANLIIKPGSITLPAMLQKAGYQTGIVGKWHLGLGNGKIDWNGEIGPGPLEVGFDYQFLMPATLDRVPTVFLEGHRVVNPDPASPIRVSYEGKIGNEPTGFSNPEKLVMKADPQHSGTIVNGVSRIGFMEGGKSARWVDQEMPDLFMGKVVNFMETNKDRPFFLYYAMAEPHVPRMPNERFAGKTALGPRGDVIVQLDWEVGEIMKTLDRLGLAENTLVIFSSDNGPILNDGYTDGSVVKNGDHKPGGPFRGHKYESYEGGTRVPFIVHWPGRVKPGISGALMCHVDFLASLAKLTGQAFDKVSSPDSLDLLPALLGETTTGRQSLVEQGVAAWGLRDEDWKMVKPIDPKTTGGEKMETVSKTQLYNLKDDPGERNDLASSNPKKLAEMEALLEQIRR